MGTIVYSSQPYDQDSFTAANTHGIELHFQPARLIGATFAKIMSGFGCRLLASDPCPEVAALGARYLPLQDDVLARLLTFPNVLITAHQAFLTREALAAIAKTTLGNISDWVQGRPRNLIEA
jgi:lactate dehydrogenase-like 2-hydroxyacid dehydrogenase